MKAILDKWTGEAIGNVRLFSFAEAAEATQRSQVAFEAMRALSSYERKGMLASIVAKITERRVEFRDLIAREAGKPLPLAEAEVTRAIETFTLAMEECTRIVGEGLSVDVTPAAKGYTARTMRVPSGPVLAITPFNFPLNLVAHKVAPALACGCSVVLKPAPQAPLTAHLLADCIESSGAPKNAVQVVDCDNDVAESLVRSTAFACLSFTGSDKVGWHLRALAGKKRVTLELGGNAAVIVHDDAVLDVASDRIFKSAFGHSGQVCIKTQRLYVHERVADDLLARLVALAEGQVAPCSMKDATLVSPLIDEAAAVRVASWIEEARAHGAEQLAGGDRHGAWLRPTILVLRGPSLDLKVVSEEAFGPVLTVHKYATWDEALRMADASRFGLQSGIFTDSHARIEEAWQRLHVGGLIVNDTPNFRVDSMPYGGVRDSGTGREGVRYAIGEMTEPKVMVSRVLSTKSNFPG